MVAACFTRFGDGHSDVSLVPRVIGNACINSKSRHTITPYNLHVDCFRGGSLPIIDTDEIYLPFGKMLTFRKKDLYASANAAEKFSFSSCTVCHLELTLEGVP